jgi:hypothetical protein
VFNICLFRRELETSYFGEDGKRSPIPGSTCFYLSDLEWDLLIARQFKADMAKFPNLRCSRCTQEFRRKLYEDYHWCKVAKRGYSRPRKIQITWEPERAGSSTPSNDQETMTSCQPNARWVTTCVICLVNFLIESLHALQPGRDPDWENIVQVSP